MLKDKRSEKIAIVAHCILNQNSRAQGLAERSSAIAEIVEFLMLNDMGIIHAVSRINVCWHITEKSNQKPIWRRNV